MSRRSWLPVAASSPFSLANIPFGIISTKAAPQHRPATVIGENVIDLKVFAEKNGFQELDAVRGNLHVFSSTTLNAFAALGRPVHSKVRTYLQDVLTQGAPRGHIFQNNNSLRQEAVLPLGNVTLHLPMDIGDYTDFFVGINHAFAVGSMFRGAENALQPNYRHLPVAYHGRASSVVLSKTPIRRPSGQILTHSDSGDKVPTFPPSRRLDIEL